jgi:hypothetical protein
MDVNLASMLKKGGGSLGTKNDKQRLSAALHWA